jgi:hypothetical protein
MNTATQAKQRHQPPAQPKPTALEPQKTSRGNADDATTRQATIPWQRCPVCGYRAIPRDGLLIHEAAALFPVTLLNCDNPSMSLSQWVTFQLTEVGQTISEK